MSITDTKIKLILTGSKGVAMAKTPDSLKKTLVDFKVSEDTNADSPKIPVIFDGTKETKSVFMRGLKFTQLKTKIL